MNYLAHIHQAHVSETSLLGNFLGDFVKGSNLSYLPTELEQGIRLHRQIDTFTDNHGIIKLLRQGFPPELRRMSGVVIDIYFDHLLCKHWQTYTQIELDNMLDNFYDELIQHKINIHGRYSQVKAGLLEYKWLKDYQQIDSCFRAFYQIEKRLKNKVIFAELAQSYVENNHEHLEQSFLSFYPTLTAFSLSQVKKGRQNLSS